MRKMARTGLEFPRFHNWFNFNKLHSKLLKTESFIHSSGLIFFYIFSYFLPLNGYNMVTSLPRRVHKRI
jgi:hypothetical protein